MRWLIFNRSSTASARNYPRAHRDHQSLRCAWASITTPARYILLEASPNPDQEVRDFRDALRSCTEGSLGSAGGSEYAEEKFEQVKRIIVRFPRTRKVRREADRRWTEKVTDVPPMVHVFGSPSATREGDGEFEHYTDSGGKSGGQKEKLAYTVLAASLAYQFGLEVDSARTRSFRFVVIDEAFGRGSDESARYGLKLFASLDLQLLIVTPLQKIHIIEPFISSVGFVHNEDGAPFRCCATLTIEEYRAERARRTEPRPGKGANAATERRNYLTMNWTLPEDLRRHTCNACGTAAVFSPAPLLAELPYSLSA